MSLVEKVLTILHYSSDYPKIYALLRDGVRSKGSASRSDFSVSENSLRVTLSRLKQKGLVKNENGQWKITSKGSFFLKQNKIRTKSNLPKHTTKQKTSRKKNMIIVFDIPETQKRKREWLRIELVNLGFKMLQQSVWLGPAPLPEKFVKSLNDLTLLPYIKFFKVKEEDVV